MSKLQDELGFALKHDGKEWLVIEEGADDRCATITEQVLWRALTYDSGPYDLTTPNLALQELGAAFYAAGYAEAPKTTTKVEVSLDPEMVRRTLRAEAEVALLRAALTLPENATEPMQRAMQKAVLLRKSMNEVWRAALSELGA